MKELLYQGALIACILVLSLCVAAEVAIQLVPIPDGHSKIGADWYLLIHYWDIHLTLVASIFGFGLLLNRKQFRQSKKSLN